MTGGAVDHLLDLQRALADSRARLGALADRLEGLRQRALGAGASSPSSSSSSPFASPRGLGGAPQPEPFGGLDARPIDDLELTFQAVDVEGAADQDKVR